MMKKLLVSVIAIASVSVLSGCNSTPFNPVEQVTNQISAFTGGDEEAKVFTQFANVVNKHTAEPGAKWSLKIIRVCQAIPNLNYQQYKGQQEFAPVTADKCKKELLAYAKKGDPRFKKSVKGHEADFTASQQIIAFYQKQPK
jgi:hypothetical protein